MVNGFAEMFGENFEHLRVISSCPVCRTRYHSAELQVLDERHDAQLVHLRCRKCQSSVLAVIRASQLGISSVGVVTDLSGDDVLKFRRQPVITGDDVLDLHVALGQLDFPRSLDYP